MTLQFALQNSHSGYHQLHLTWSLSTKTFYQPSEELPGEKLMSKNHRNLFGVSQTANSRFVIKLAVVYWNETVFRVCYYKDVPKNHRFCGKIDGKNNYSRGKCSG